MAIFEQWQPESAKLQRLALGWQLRKKELSVTVLQQEKYYKLDGYFQQNNYLSIMVLWDFHGAYCQKHTLRFASISSKYHRPLNYIKITHVKCHNCGQIKVCQSSRKSVLMCHSRAIETKSPPVPKALQWWSQRQITPCIVEEAHS